MSYCSSSFWDGWSVVLVVLVVPGSEARYVLSDSVDSPSPGRRNAREKARLRTARS
jgi:hypothetical protein